MGTITGTANRLVDQTIVDGVVVDETLEPISDGRIAIPELDIDMPLVVGATFDLSNLPASADRDNPTEVTVVFTAPGLGSFTYLYLRIGPGYRPILTPVLIDTPRVDDHSLARRPDVIHEPQTSLGLAEVPVDQPAHDTDSVAPLTAQQCQPSGDQHIFPQTIRVWENGPDQDQTVHTVDFKFYVKHVLPREWRAFWDMDALKAGAMAVKSFAWWHAGNAHKHIPGPECYDVDALENHQVFDPFDSDGSTNDAVDATWDYYMIEGGHPVHAFYQAGHDPETCGWYHGAKALGYRMSQNGSKACADDNMLWPQILTTYYFPPLVSWTLLDATIDHDQDGCSTKEEFGPNEVLGGRRDWNYFWDFYDMEKFYSPKSIGFLDQLALQQRFNTTDDGKRAPINRNSDPLTTPDPGAGNYHPLYDRGGIMPGGDPWDELPADGYINFLDFLSLIRQYGHTCFAPP